MTDTIKAVAEALRAAGEVIDPCAPSECDAYIKVKNALAAIEAMQIRKMTVGEVANIISNSIRDMGDFSNAEEVADDAAQTLAKLGTIRIVGEV